MSKEKVIEYVMNSPYNTNRAVLEGLLDDMGGDEYTLLFEDSVNIVEEKGQLNVSPLQYEELIDASTLKVTYDGVEYECDIYAYHNRYYYGAPFDDTEEEVNIDFSKYPFVLVSTPDEKNMIVTSVPGIHTIKVEIPSESQSGSNGDLAIAEVSFVSLEGEYQVSCAQQHQKGPIIIEEISVMPTYDTTVFIPISIKDGYTISHNDIFHADYTNCVVTGNISRWANNDFSIFGNGTITLTGEGDIPES